MAETTTPMRPDPVIEAYKPGVDRTLLIENLRLTPEERLERLQQAVLSLASIRGAGAPRRR